MDLDSKLRKGTKRQKKSTKKEKEIRIHLTSLIWVEQQVFHLRRGGFFFSVSFWRNAHFSYPIFPPPTLLFFDNLLSDDARSCWVFWTFAFLASFFSHWFGYVLAGEKSMWQIQIQKEKNWEKLCLEILGILVAEISAMGCWLSSFFLGFCVAWARGDYYSLLKKDEENRWGWDGGYLSENFCFSLSKGDLAIEEKNAGWFDCSMVHSVLHGFL